MNVAIFGATSQIAKDLIVRFAKENVMNCTLFSRREADVDIWLEKQGIAHRFSSKNYTYFSDRQKFDAIINLVGVGNPARAANMGTTIFDVTKNYDDIVVDYLQNVNKKCKYIFFSSGAAYGNSFSIADDLQQEAKFSINDLTASDWYGLAKFKTEISHRMLDNFIICDLRVFSYFSETQDINNSFMMSELVSAIFNNKTFETNDSILYRDFIHPDDLFSLVNLILERYESNGALDCYSKQVVEKQELVNFLAKKFGLKFKINKAEFNSSYRNKTYYYARNKDAGNTLGYEPKFTSLSTIAHVIEQLRNS
ncbi:NAD-dependent epimerase/dehydratase family protein [Aliivibrio fischeri]|uniref:NAD-dependent epimerase/dehydratase family protein n=1 Tax=Aliivibrio fischeri TaxID=668 RepID=UPI0012D86BDF|nr:NAD(P)-dependent oxidoreductase [Aliivibrio fischeri]MUK26525.1 NAD-dependent epimerase/dehydratase family protein [Aliivibrio fischeri]MUK33713.1 NAD-dependent epimerase/dehydratase family protein [Aliivibrio fischeri]